MRGRASTRRRSPTAIERWRSTNGWWRPTWPGAASTPAWAVLLDRRYAPAYCNERGLAHAARGQFDCAAADHTIALLLDPGNVKARAWRESALDARTRVPPTDQSAEPLEDLNEGSDHGS